MTKPINLQYVYKKLNFDIMKPPYPKELTLKKKHYCMKKGYKLIKIGYDTYRCEKANKCQNVWHLKNLIDKI